MLQKRYLHEVDFLRNFFILGVLSNHVVGIFKNQYDYDSSAYLIFGSAHAALHFTRMGFMFMTGLVLFLAYKGGA